MKPDFHMDIPPKGYAAGVVILSLFFLAGVVTACLLVSGSGDETLLPFMTDYVTTLSGGAPAVSWLSSLFDAFLYPTIAFLCGFSALGILLTPLVLAVRGFFLSLTISSFFKVFGAHGLLLALGMEGIPGLFTVPCLFLIGLCAFFSSLSLFSLARGGAWKAPLYGASYFIRFALCSVALLGSALFQVLAVPSLLPWITANLL